MELRTYNDANVFATTVVPILRKGEAENNLALGILLSLARDEGKHATDAMLALVRDHQRILLVLVQTPPHNVIVVAADTDYGDALPFTVDACLDAGIEFPGVIGSTPLAGELAAAWAKRTGRQPVREMQQRIYRLDAVNPLPRPPGEFHIATEADVPLVADWLAKFEREALNQEAGDGFLELAQQRIANRSIYLWSNNGPVSMAGTSRPTGSGITVSLVYSPKEHRRHGYATACVAELSRRLLGEYTYCTLYTDLSNPISNRIYTRIGYQPVCDSAVYRFHR